MSASSELVVRVQLPAGVALHARPAADFVRLASRAESEIRIAANGRSANGKSILEVLGLGATGGTELEISAAGPDAVETLDGLAELVSRLG